MTPDLARRSGSVVRASGTASGVAGRSGNMPLMRRSRASRNGVRMTWSATADASIPFDTVDSSRPWTKRAARTAAMTAKTSQAYVPPPSSFATRNADRQPGNEHSDADLGFRAVAVVRLVELGSAKDEPPTCLDQLELRDRSEDSVGMVLIDQCEVRFWSIDVPVPNRAFELSGELGHIDRSRSRREIVRQPNVFADRVAADADERPRVDLLCNAHHAPVPEGPDEVRGTRQHRQGRSQPARTQQRCQGAVGARFLP